MGLIDLLKLSIDHDEAFKKIDKDSDGYEWLIEKRLRELSAHIEKIVVEPEDLSNIEKQLVRIAENKRFKNLIDKIRSSNEGSAI